MASEREDKKGVKGKVSKRKPDYSYCSVCRRNHNDGREAHIFSERHKSGLKIILDKFNKKIHSARCLIQKPNVIDGDLEPGIRVWCYCCQEEVDKHVSDGFTTIEWGGLLEHMTSKSHHKKTRHYCWENGIKKSQMQNLILFQAELDRFKELVTEKLEKLNTHREERLKESAKEIEEVEETQRLVVTQTKTQEHSVLPVHALMSTEAQCSSTAAKRKGNIHTGATPPWLLDDDDEEVEEDSTGVCFKHPIGPSEDDFLHWRDKHGKGKRNPKRIGANFHSNLRKLGQLDKDDPNWLPSFGGVWNAGPRSHTKMDFESKLHQQSSHKTEEQSVVQPYVSKRKRPHPEQ